MHPLFKVSFLLPLLIWSFKVQAQDQRISGKVIDQSTGEPLSFSHVGILEASYGTVANLGGDFSLILPAGYKDEKLSASYLGYELKSIPISTIDPSKELIIALEPNVTELSELVVSTREKSIIEEAIEAIPKNHDQTEMKLRAFWRASIQNESKQYIQMTEYAFDMFRHGAPGDESNAMQILHGRIARDTSFFEDLAGMQIGVTPPSLFTSSLLKGHGLLDKKIIKKHTYSITDVTSYNGNAVFVVSFAPKPKAKGKLYKGQILLDSETLAFVKISFSKVIDPDDPDRVFDGLSMASMVVGLGKSTLDQYENELNYQLVDGRWYLSHARYDIHWTMRRSKMGVVKPVKFNADFVVTNIQKTDIIVPPEDQLTSKGILERQVTKSTSEFWKEYNYLKADNNFEALFQEILNRE